ncbi:MAG: flagellar motor switch protein FliN [Gammaproteobacteria bacterium]|nr:flagellar motor switch protein FliN [Gammaproteobacteria bacterium]
MSEETTTDNADSGDDWSAAMAEQSGSEPAAAEPPVEEVSAVQENVAQQGKADEYERAAFKELNGKNNQLTTGETNLDVILDIPVTLSMEIGRTELPIHNLLQLNQGSVVELDRLAGEPLDVLINGTLIAHGEVVVVNEKFGIRLTDVISPAERVKNLK